MKKSCKHCGRVHASAFICPERPPPKPRKGRGGREAKFRSTAAWQRKRAEVQERDRYLCKACASRGDLVWEGLEVHHIEPLSERYELRLDGANLVTLCAACHAKAEAGEPPPGALRKLAASEVPPLLLRRRRGRRAHTNPASCARK